MHASIAGQLIEQVEDLHFKRFRFPLSEAKLLLEVGHPEGKAVSLLAYVHELFWVADPVEHADQEEELARSLRFMSHRGQTLALQFVVGIRVRADSGLQMTTGVHLHQAPLLRHRHRRWVMARWSATAGKDWEKVLRQLGDEQRYRLKVMVNCTARPRRGTSAITCSLRPHDFAPFPPQ